MDFLPNNIWIALALTTPPTLTAMAAIISALRSSRKVSDKLDKQGIPPNGTSMVDQLNTMQSSFKRIEHKLDRHIKEHRKRENGQHYGADNPRGTEGDAT